jgi:hypothetical protein
VCWNITRVKSVVTVQSAFRAKYAKDPPTDKTIRTWYKQDTETGCLCKQKSSGRPLTAEDDVERVRASFLRSAKKSTGTAAKELSLSNTTLWRFLGKCLVFKPHCIQIVQQLSDEDHRRRLDFCFQLQDLIFRHRASCILGQAFHCSPENAFYIFNQQIYFII